jgi:molybdopterin converting factor small subunit
MTIKLVISGRSYDLAAGLAKELTLDEGAGVEQAVQAINALLGEGQSLSATCLIAVGSEHLGTISAHTARTLQEGDELTLITPVAGG